MVRSKLGLAAVAGLLLTLPAVADDAKKAEAPDEKAMMEAMAKAGTPGEHHKKLEPLAGKWDVSIKMWMDPSKPPSESKATAEAKWFMGGRFLRMTVTGDFGGMKFEGVGITGYDNLRQTYTGAWIDNMSTCIVHSTGKYDAASKTFTSVSEEIDPLTKKKLKNKDVIKIVDDNHYTETFYKVEGGREVKVMELAATRVK